MNSRSTVWLIARHEITRYARSRALVMLGVLLTLLLVTAAVIGWRNYETLNHQRGRYQQLVREQWDNQPERHPHRTAHYGYLVFRPKAPLGFFDFGIDSYAGTTLFLEAHRQNATNFSEARHSGGMLRFGELSMATVLQLFVPLVIFFLGFSAITSERETGTLPLLLCQGVSWRALFAGKIIGLLVAVTLLLLPVVVVCSLVLMFIADIELTFDTGVRALLLIIGYAIYFAVCAMIAVLVSGLHRTSRSALMSLVGVWILLWVVMPRALPAIAASVFPTPAKAAFDARMEADARQHGDSHNPNDPHFAQLKKNLLQQYGVSTVEELPVNFGGIVMREAERFTAETFQQHYTDLLKTYQRQNRFSEIAAFINPYLAMRHFSATIAGSDFAHYVDFQWRAETFRYRFVQQLNEIHATEIKYVNDRAQRIGSDRWSEFEAFDYSLPKVDWALAQQPLTALALAGWLLLIVMLSRLVERYAMVL